MDTEVGVDVQAYDADLTAIGGLAKTDGNIIVGNGSTWVAESGATARTSLGLGSIATQASSSVTITGGSITGITDLAVADGGTGQGSYTDGELLIGNTTGNTLTKATLTAGTGISVTNGSGAITIASTAGGGGSYKAQIFASTGTWTNPGSVSEVTVTVIGGGGGSGTLGSPGAQTSGNTSSFGSLVTATGGARSTTGPNSANPGTPGNGAANAGTIIVDHYVVALAGPTGSTSRYGYLNGLRSSSSPTPTAAKVFSNTAQYGAGLGGSPAPSPTLDPGGDGGVAIVTGVPTPGPVPVTVGTGGTGNPNPGIGGAVIVEWIE
jgi:hypothetical protein